MVRKTSLITVIAVIISIFWVFTAVIVVAEEANLDYYNEAFDLETGDKIDVYDNCLGSGGYGGMYCPEPYDFYIEEDLSFVLFPINGAQVAVLPGEGYENVDYQLANSQTLSSDSVHVGTGDSADVVVVRTADDNLFKVGNAADYNGDYNGGYSVEFEYSLLPPPVAFGEALYREVTVGTRKLCINLATAVVYDCANLYNPLEGFEINNMEFEIPGGETGFQPVQQIKDQATIRVGDNTCYPWCYNGFYYVLCY